MPFLAPVLPDPGVEFQLVHHDDVAAAIVAATLGEGEPGTYNLAGPGTMKISDLARSLGWWALPVPATLIGPLDEVLSRLPGLPAEFAWLTAFRTPVVMDTRKAREELGWSPAYDCRDTLAGMIRGAREHDVL